MVEKKAMAKVVLLGEMGVGKTTLLNSFMGN
jgi:GTPase SAR1 family protein